MLYFATFPDKVPDGVCDGGSKRNIRLQQPQDVYLPIIETSRKNVENRGKVIYGMCFAIFPLLPILFFDLFCFEPPISTSFECVYEQITD